MMGAPVPGEMVPPAGRRREPGHVDTRGAMVKPQATSSRGHGLRLLQKLYLTDSVRLDVADVDLL